MVADFVAGAALVPSASPPSLSLSAQPANAPAAFVCPVPPVGATCAALPLALDRAAFQSSSSEEESAMAARGAGGGLAGRGASGRASSESLVEASNASRRAAADTAPPLPFSLAASCALRSAAPPPAGPLEGGAPPPATSPPPAPKSHTSSSSPLLPAARPGPPLPPPDPPLDECSTSRGSVRDANPGGPRRIFGRGGRGAPLCHASMSAFVTVPCLGSLRRKVTPGARGAPSRAVASPEDTAEGVAGRPPWAGSAPDSAAAASLCSRTSPRTAMAWAAACRSDQFLACSREMAMGPAWPGGAAEGDTGSGVLDARISSCSSLSSSSSSTAYMTPMAKAEAFSSVNRRAASRPPATTAPPSAPIRCRMASVSREPLAPPEAPPWACPDAPSAGTTPLSKSQKPSLCSLPPSEATLPAAAEGGGRGGGATGGMPLPPPPPPPVLEDGLGGSTAMLDAATAWAAALPLVWIHASPMSSLAVLRKEGVFLKHSVRNALNVGLAKGGRGGHGSCTMRNSADMGSRSKYGGSPVIISITVHPTAQMSEAADAPDISTTSGASQYGVPATPMSPSVASTATPKSASLMVPCPVTSRLAPLMSRCTTPCSCRYARPRRICTVYMAATCSDRGPNILMRDRMLPWSTYL